MPTTNSGSRSESSPSFFSWRVDIASFWGRYEKELQLVACGEDRVVALRDCSSEFRGDPLVGHNKALAQGNRGLPTQHSASTAVLTVASAHALRSRKVVTDFDFLSGSISNHLHQLVDRDQFRCSKIQRLVVVGSHDAL